MRCGTTTAFAHIAATLLTLSFLLLGTASAAVAVADAHSVLPSPATQAHGGGHHQLALNLEQPSFIDGDGVSDDEIDSALHTDTDMEPDSDADSVSSTHLDSNSQAAETKSILGVVELLRSTWDVLASSIALPELPEIRQTRRGMGEHSGRVRGRYMRRGRSHP